MTNQDHNDSQKQIVLVSQDKEFLKTIDAKAFESTDCNLLVVENELSCIWEDLSKQTIDALVVDLGNISLGELEALQHMKRTLPKDTPVIVLVEDYNNSIIRMLFQMQINDFLVKPVTFEELARTISTTLKSAQQTENDNAEIYTFLPAAGGVGNTVLALQTAFLRHEERRAVESTCVVDMNFQTGSCTEYLDLEPRFMIEDIENEVDRLDKQLLDTMLARHSSGLAILAAPNVISEQRTFDPDIVIRLLDLVSTYFDTVIIDMPRIWFPWTETVLRGADHVFVTAEATVPCMRHTQRLLKGIADETGGEVQPSVIINRYSDGSKNGVQRSDMEAVLGDAFVGTVSNNYAMVCKAIDSGVPLHEVDAKSNLIADLRKIILKDEIVTSADTKKPWFNFGKSRKSSAA